jgi:phosphatidate phosphatase LPIN
MKVGEAGEAFFVLETEEDVPEELLTSPVVMPTDVSDVQGRSWSQSPDDHDISPPEETNETVDNSGPSLTQQPFGATEEQVNHAVEPKRRLSEVEFLDLNADVEHSADSGNLDSNHSSPSIQAIAPVLRPTMSSEDIRSSGTEYEQPKHAPELPENPMTASPGESTAFPEHNEKLSTATEEKGYGDRALPKIQQGAGEGPDVVYGKDVVLDMAGYHSEGIASDSREDDVRSTTLGGNHKDPAQKAIDTLIDQFAVDLLASTARPAFLPKRASELTVPKTVEGSAIISSNSSAIKTMDTGRHSSSPRRRFDRGISEPPPDRDEEEYKGYQSTTRDSPLRRTPQGTVIQTIRGAHTNVTGGGLHSDVGDDIDDSHQIGQAISSSTSTQPMVEDRVRADSLPPATLDLVPNVGLGRLKNVEENPYLFVLEAEGRRSHTFELSLCGPGSFALNGDASVSSLLR